MYAGGRPDGEATGGAGAGAGVGVCVDGGVGAVELEGGATMGGAAVSVAARPLLAAMGAVAQVPTQWSGDGGAACEVAVIVVKARRKIRQGRVGRRGRVVTEVCQPRKKVLAAPYYAGFVAACRCRAWRGRAAFTYSGDGICTYEFWARSRRRTERSGLPTESRPGNDWGNDDDAMDEDYAAIHDDYSRSTRRDGGGCGYQG